MGGSWLRDNQTERAVQRDKTNSMSRRSRSPATMPPKRVLVFFASCFISGAQGGFSITDDSFDNSGNVLLKVLRNDGTGEYASVIHTHGGGIDQVRLLGQGATGGCSGEMLDILDDHGRDSDAVIANERWKGRILLPFANRIANGTYTAAGKTYFLDRNECSDPADRCGSLHGLLHSYRMQVVMSEASHESARLTLRHVFDGHDRGYPWRVRVDVTYSLTASSFRVKVEARNEGLEPAPFFMAWHPYFRVDDVPSASIVLDPRCSWLHVLMEDGAPRRGTLIPRAGHVLELFPPSRLQPLRHEPRSTYPVYWDDEFRYGKCSPPASVSMGVIKATIARSDTLTKLPDVSALRHAGLIETRLRSPGRPTVVLFQDAGPFRYLQLFTGAFELFGSKSIALEPQSAMADAFNNKMELSVIKPEGTWQGEFGLRVECSASSLK